MQLGLSLIISICLLSCSCQKKEACPSEETMRICFNRDPPTVDPRKSAEIYASTLNFLIYEGLTRSSPNGGIELALAQSIEISADGLIYLFHLRDAFWSDGMPVTAQDFEYSWKKILTAEFGSPCAHLLFPIKNGEISARGELSQDLLGVKALDEKTLRVELEYPTPYFLSLISFCSFYPVPMHVELKNPAWQNSIDQNLVTNGPFKLTQWIRSEKLELKKNPLYWDAEHVHLLGIQISIIPDGKTALQMYENGELDFISTVTTPLSTEDLDFSREEGKLQLTPMGGLLFCTFNLDQFPFNNTHLRKALSYAIDRKGIAENLHQLADIPATRCIPPVLVNLQNRPLFPDFDPLQARKFLALALKEIEEGRAGSENQLESRALAGPWVLSYEAGDQPRKIAQAIQQGWKKSLNIEIQLQESDPKTHFDHLLNRKYQIALDHLIVQYNDPNNILERFKYKHMKKNLPGFQNETYIDLLNQAARMNNAKQRLELLEKAEELLMSEMPMTPIYHFNQGFLIDSKFENVEFSPLGNLLFHKITIREEL